jgi:spermidine/putrescine transport system substrate-binding protein
MRKWISSVVTLISCGIIFFLLLPLSSVAQGKTLHLYNWAEYIDPEIVSSFEKETKIKVIESVYESNEDMIAKLQGGGVSQYDVVVPSEYIIPTMLDLKLLQSLDKNKIPNIKNLSPKFLNHPVDPDNIYTLPYLWGTTGLAYRKDKLTPDFKRSWGLIFDPVQQQGPFVLINDQRDMIGAAALFLGYDINTTKKAELQEIQKLLIQTKKRSSGFIDGVGGKNQLLSKTANVAVIYSGEALQASDEDPNVDYFIPEEGAKIWIDLLAIPSRAPHLEAAYRFINYLLDSEVGAKLANYTRSPTPNQASLALINAADKSNPMIYPDEQTQKKLYYTNVLTPEEAKLMDALWTSVKSG